MKTLLFLILSPIILMAQAPALEIPLWENGAPGFEELKDEPTVAKDWWIKNIHNPTITAYLPDPEIATGAAVVIAPGGGHKELVFNAEGRDAAIFLNSLGVAAFALKYRLAKEEGSRYTVEKHVRQDIFRAMRLVRYKAAEFNIDSSRIGVMGFSAGGEVAALIAYDKGNTNPHATDIIDRQKARPDFQILIYPGGTFIPDTIPSWAPPAFLLVAFDDPWCFDSSMEILQKYKAAKISIEAHIYSHGSHAFNMGDRSKLQSIHSWPQRLADWLSDNGYLNSTGK
jgi:acetyl esterase/lipase